MRQRNTGRAEVSPGFVFLTALLFYLDATGIVLMSLLACALHESGHCVALFLLDNNVRLFNFTVFGAGIVPEKPMNYLQELSVAAAGPGINLLLAGAAALCPGGAAFAGVNLALAVFNLLPVGNLDGGRMLRCLLAQIGTEELSARISACLDFCFTVAFSCIGFWNSLRWGNLTLLLMSLWLVFRGREDKMSFFQKKYGERGCQMGRKRLK